MFNPTYLMVKRHRNTGLMYFCKTSNRDPLKYRGSGSYWKKHLKIHGKDVDTLWYQLFDSEEELVEFALFFSEFNDIVSAVDTRGKKIWANEIPENGLQGGQNKGLPSPQKGVPTGRPSVWKGKSRPDHSEKMKGRKFTEEHSLKISQALKNHKRTVEHSRAISDAKKGIPNPKVSLALTGRPGHNKGKKLKTYLCEHCGLETSRGNITRWHGNNCKKKGNNNETV